LISPARSGLSVSLLWFGASTNQWALTVKYCEASDFVPDLVGFLGKVAETERN
jgi:hypothetical protein